MLEEGEVITPPFKAVHKPTPGEGLLPFNVPVAVEVQTWILFPALDVIGVETTICIVSRLIHAPFVIVQIKLYAPATIKEETEDEGLEGVEIITLEEVDQRPTPGEGLFPANKTVPGIEQTV